LDEVGGWKVGRGRGMMEKMFEAQIHEVGEE